MVGAVLWRSVRARHGQDLDYDSDEDTGERAARARRLKRRAGLASFFLSQRNDATTPDRDPDRKQHEEPVTHV